MRLDMVRGDKRVFEVTLTDAEGSALNLTDMLLTFTAKSSINDADEDAVFQKTVGSGITVETPSSGVATITIDPEDTDALDGPRTMLVWDLQVESDDHEDIQTPLSGRLLIHADVTRGIVS